MHAQRHTGLTLVEILIAITILMVLAAIVIIPNYMRVQRNAYDAGAVNCAKTIQQAQTQHHSRTFTYAATPEELNLRSFTPCNPDTQYLVLTSEATPTSFTFTVKHANGPTIYSVSNQTITQHIPTEEN